MPSIAQWRSLIILTAHWFPSVRKCAVKRERWNNTLARCARAALTERDALTSRAARAARKHRLTSGPMHSDAETRFLNEKVSIVLQVDDALHRVGAVTAKNGHWDQWQIVCATLWERLALHKPAASNPAIPFVTHLYPDCRYCSWQWPARTKRFFTAEQGLSRAPIVDTYSLK